MRLLLSHLTFGVLLGVVVTSAHLPAMAQDAVPLFTPLDAEALGFVLEYPTEDSLGVTGGADYGGGGLAVRDFTGDGHLDILLAGGLSRSTTLLVHDGEWGFQVVTEEAGLADLGWEKGLTAAHYDNDGDADVFIAVAGGLSALLRNDGGTFTNVSEAAGLMVTGDARVGVWSDYDRDGHVDLYVVRYGEIPAGEANTLHRNLGDGTFEDVSEAAAIQYDPPGPGEGHVGNTWSALAWDVDQDGHPEFHDVNDWGYKHYKYGHKVWKSDAGALPFSLAPPSEGTGVQCNCMGAAVGDLNGDGTLDFYGANTHHGNLLVYNHCGALGPDSGALLDVDVGWLSWSPALEDFDLNGELDIYLATWHETNNRMFLQQDGVFAELGEATNTHGKFWEATTAVGSDLDQDGDEDILLYSVDSPLVLFRNEGPVGHGVHIVLEGVQSNREAIGALVEARASGISRTLAVMSPTTFLSSGDRAVTVGLGSVESLDEVRVRWPSGLEQTFLGPWPSGSRITLVEGAQGDLEPPGESWLVETCGDAIDNDCDGLIDEGYELNGEPCVVGLGECAADGVWECHPDGLQVVCPAAPGEPAPEICDGVDNDCNGEVDEGLVAKPCTSGIGACAVNGEEACLGVDGWLCDAVPLPAGTEACGDTIDNDCDGETDEGFTELGSACESGTLPCLGIGTWTCGGGSSLLCLDLIWPYAVAERCEDQVDNDCDGETDEGFTLLGEICDPDPLCAGDSGRWVCDETGAMACAVELPCPPPPLPEADAPSPDAANGGCLASGGAGGSSGGLCAVALLFWICARRFAPVWS